MKKNIISILLIVSIIVPITAFSWVGNVNAGAVITGATTDLSLEQADRITFSFHAPLEGENPASISGEAFYDFTYSTNLADTTNSTIENLVDLASLKYNVRIPLENASYYTLDIGRFGVSDLTGITLNQPADGVRFVYDNEDFQLNAYVGFTGLLNAYSVTMNVAPNNEVLSSVYTLAAPFVLGNVTAYFPQLLAGQNLFAEAFAAIDVASTTVPDNRVYATAALSGPMSEVLYYTLSTTVGITQTTQDAWSIANMSIFELSAFIPASTSIVSWKTIFATGGADSSYATFTAESATLDDSLEYAGHIKTGIIGTLRPMDTLLVFLEPNVLLNIMNDAEPTGYAGFQWQLAARWEILSDLRLLASFGQFLPSDQTADAYMEADIKLSFDF